MSSPRIGVVRDSMLTNPRIIKASLGQTRCRNVSVPGPDFTFGVRSNMKEGGVAEALSSWNVQAPLEPAALPAQDFVSLNRDAVKSGIVTSKQLNQYRALRGGTLAPGPAPKQQRGRTTRTTAVPDITFGVKNRTPSPFAELLSHQYAERWRQQQLMRSQTSSRKLCCGQETRTSVLRRTTTLPAPQKPFVLPQFSQVAPALDTFRDPEARHRAMKDQDPVPVPGSSGGVQKDQKEQELK
ncbi:uncharacterized protein V6R79_022860 [Siganus canaliculatus]